MQQHEQGPYPKFIQIIFEQYSGQYADTCPDVCPETCLASKLNVFKEYDLT